MTENEKFISDWLKQYLLNRAVTFTDKRYETKTISSMKILSEKPPDLIFRKQTLISNLPFHKQLPNTDTALLYEVLIEFIDYLLK